VFTGCVANGIKFVGSYFFESKPKCKPEQFTPVDLTGLSIKSLLESLSDRIHPIWVRFKRTDERSEVPIPDANRLLFVTGINRFKFRNNISNKRTMI